MAHKSEVDLYIDRYTEFLRKQLALLVETCEQEFFCKPVWDPTKQAWHMGDTQGRIRKYYWKRRPPEAMPEETTNSDGALSSGVVASPPNRKI